MIIQKSIMFKRFESFIRFYIGSGWVLFLPYLLLYLIFLYLNLKLSILNALFSFLHIFNLIFIIYFIIYKFKCIDIKSNVFWLGIFLSFLLPGVYLEYPSDAWTHVGRIFQWENIEYISEAESWHKFSYFFGFSLWKLFFYKEKLIFLDFYYVFWGILLSIQFYFLGIKVGLKESWNKVAVFSLIILMGNSSFSFFRYYGISSTMLSTTSYLAAFIYAIDYLKFKNKKNLIYIFFSLFLSCWNHQQGILLFLCSSIGIILYAYKTKHNWKYFLTILLCVVILSNIIFNQLIDNISIINFKDVVNTTLNFDLWLYSYGGFKIFSMNPHLMNASGRFISILGFIGLLNIIAAIFLIKSNRIIAWISLTPILLLLYPPFSLTLTYLLCKYDTVVVFHRVLFSIPQGFCIVYLFQYLYKKYKLSKLINEKYIQLSIIFLFIYLSTFNHNHFFGRFQNTFINFENQFINDIFKVSEFCHENLELKSSNFIISDKFSELCLKKSLGINDGKYFHDRHIPQTVYSRISSLGGINSIIENKNITGILALRKYPEFNIIESQLGRSSKHWNEHVFVKNFKYCPKKDTSLETLVSNGWMKYNITSLYKIYIRK